MDVSHTGDNVLLSPRHLTSLYLRLPWRRGWAVMLMTVGSSCPPECCQDGIKHTHTHTECPKGTHDREHQITQRDMASHSPKDNDDTSVHSNLSIQGAHINTLYSHTEVTENTLWHTPAQLSMKMTSESQLGEMSSPSAQHDNQQRLKHTATLNSRDKANWLHESESSLAQVVSRSFTWKWTEIKAAVISSHMLKSWSCATQKYCSKVSYFGKCTWTGCD